MSSLEIGCGIICLLIVSALLARSYQTWRVARLMKPEGTPIRSASIEHRSQGPPPGFTKVDSTVQAGHLVWHHGEEHYAVEVVHRIDDEYRTWAKLVPLPGPKRALDRLLDDDEVV